MNRLAPFLGLLSLAFGLGCGAGGSTPPTFRVVFMTDTHIIGPQYSCCSENSPADNASIVKTVERLTQVRETINAMQPRPDLVFVTGDIVHDAHVSPDPEWYRDNPNAYSIARDLFKGFAMPVYMVMGNHDYSIGCDDTDNYPREFSEDRFQEFFGMPPWQAVDHKGWKFMLVNSQRGVSFDVSSPKCNTTYATVGDEQMAWAKTQLDEGKPTVVMSHFMRILYGDLETGEYTSFPKLLDAHTNLRAFFAGHTHRWLDMTGFNNDITHWVLGGTRYDANNFWTVEFTENGQDFKILDQDKAIPNNSCAGTYSYAQSTPEPVPGAVDTGDCVTGADGQI